ncbi:MAG TPA: cell envelope integrity protein CreD [Chitinophagaceae bacterium]|nr:cell envelope integrity protein CreD [Chitinophagaceae bacterium]
MDTISSFWQKNKMIFKGLLIAFLVLLLLIPTVFIMSLVDERQSRQLEAIAEISSKWAGPQTSSGPVISIPYMRQTIDEKAQVINLKEYAYFLPETLDITCSVVPEKRYRGIYQVTVYTSDIQMSGKFSKFDFEQFKIPAGTILWNEAAIYYELSDVRGLKEQVVFNWGNQAIELTPGKFSNEQFKIALSGPLTFNDSSNNGGSFTMNVKTKGSENLSFVPLGKTTKVNVHSNWPNPSFTGNYLPDSRTIKDSGFDATWQILSLNRSYPQQWVNKTYELNNSQFGVNLMVPVDAYQKSMRSVKYAILCIVLTFTAFFLIELIYLKSLHPFQYVLVGFALVIFYTLLLSISEYTGFNIAYLIASVSTIALITWYISVVLKDPKTTASIAALLALMYGFIFILIQSQDYALLMGSIGLFVTIGLVMYFSRKIKWS